MWEVQRAEIERQLGERLQVRSQHSGRRCMIAGDFNQDRDGSLLPGSPLPRCHRRRTPTTRRCLRDRPGCSRQRTAPVAAPRRSQASPTTSRPTITSPGTKHATQADNDCPTTQQSPSTSSIRSSASTTAFSWWSASRIAKMNQDVSIVYHLNRKSGWQLASGSNHFGQPLLADIGSLAASTGCVRGCSIPSARSWARAAAEDVVPESTSRSAFR